MKRLIALLVLAGSLAFGGQAQAAAGFHCGQYRDTFIAAGFTPSQWVKADSIMWRVSRCDTRKHVGTAYGLMQINVNVKDFDAPVATGFQSLHSRCLFTGDANDLYDPLWTAVCARMLVSAFGWHPWGG